MALCEAVEIWSADPERKLYDGFLFVGVDRLPEVCVYLSPDAADKPAYQMHCRPATIPANWTLRPADRDADCPLLMAWRYVQDIQSTLAKAEREPEEVAHGES